LAKAPLPFLSCLFSLNTCIGNREKKPLNWPISSLTILSILLVVVSIAGVVFSPLIVTIMAPGFTRVPAQYDLTVFLNRLMFPYIFFISLVALCMGILNSLRHFAAPALSPVLLNIAMILATLTLRDFFPGTDRCAGGGRHDRRHSPAGHAMAFFGPAGSAAKA